MTESRDFFFVVFFSVEIPNVPVTVFQDDRVKIELNFNAETSNVLIVNARALGEESLDLTVMFDMEDVSIMLWTVWQERVYVMSFWPIFQNCLDFQGPQTKYFKSFFPADTNLPLIYNETWYLPNIENHKSDFNKMETGVV